MLDEPSIGSEASVLNQSVWFSAQLIYQIVEQEMNFTIEAVLWVMRETNIHGLVWDRWRRQKCSSIDYNLNTLVPVKTPNIETQPELHPKRKEFARRIVVHLRNGRGNRRNRSSDCWLLNYDCCSNWEGRHSPENVAQIIGDCNCSSELSRIPPSLWVRQKRVSLSTLEHNGTYADVWNSFSALPIYDGKRKRISASIMGALEWTIEHRDRVNCRNISFGKQFLTRSKTNYFLYLSNIVKHIRFNANNKSPGHKQFI